MGVCFLNKLNEWMKGGCDYVVVYAPMLYYSLEIISNS